MIEVRTTNPHRLVEDINKAIEEGRIVTWSVDSDGDYTYSLEQCRNRAWISVRYDDADTTIVRFVIIDAKEQKLSKTLYGIYHGRFAEMLLTHFDTAIMSLSISPLLTQYDIYSKE